MSKVGSRAVAMTGFALAPNQIALVRWKPTPYVSDPALLQIFAAGVAHIDVGLIEHAADDAKSWPMADYPVRGGPADGLLFGFAGADGTICVLLHSETERLGHYRFVDGALIWEPGRHSYRRNPPQKTVYLDSFRLDDGAGDPS